MSAEQDGKIAAIAYAREKDVPFFGICLGMQCAVIEYARNVLGLDGANSTELAADTPHPVIDIMEAQKQIENKGGTMRLGAYACELAEGSKVRDIYNAETISERHRHRFEFNDAYRGQLEAAGLIPVGTNPESGLVEIVELKDHPWFVGVQFHPGIQKHGGKTTPTFRRLHKSCHRGKTTKGQG